MNGNRKKIVAGFCVFLGLMWLCTVISKSIYASKLPIVSTEKIQQKYVEHIVEVDGIVIAGEKSPVTALSGLRVEGLAVQVGDQVEEGDVLFTIDMDDLTEIMDEKRIMMLWRDVRTRWWEEVQKKSIRLKKIWRNKAAVMMRR